MVNHLQWQSQEMFDPSLGKACLEESSSQLQVITDPMDGVGLSPQSGVTMFRHK